jgi:hypothetical protein
MRRWWPYIVLVLLVGGLVLYRSGAWRGGESARPLPVPGGDQEVAFLHISTAGETWENFVWGMKRAEMGTHGVPSGLHVDDSSAFPDRTTEVPEVVISRDGFVGRLRVRWYKVTNYAPTDAWVRALAARNPAPVAIVGGWSSDRAREVAEAMTATAWPGQKPLFLLATATADSVHPDEDNYTPDYRPPTLIGLYDRSFRFCFTNRQMAASVTDFVLTNPALRPGPAVLPGMRAAVGAGGGTRAMLPWLAELRFPLPGVSPLPGVAAEPPGIPAFAVAWKDDPYSLDLSERFREALFEQGQRPGNPRLAVELNLIQFSVGRFARPNPYEAQTVDHILANLPRRGERTVIVVPTVTAPARRVLGALAEGNPATARRLVAVTGDGIPVNALFRDGEFAWPVRAIPIPLVLFTHTDPFDWDEPTDPKPPRGYELDPPARAADVKGSTEDIELFSTMTRVLTSGAFLDGTDALVDGPDALAGRFRAMAPVFFDPSGNRLTGSGEHIVVLHPTPRVEGAVTYPDAVIEVWARQSGEWARLRARPVVQTVRPHDFGAGD